MTLFDSEAFGRSLKRRRLAMGLSAEQVALRAGTARNSMQSLERGDRLPSLTMLARVARALGVTPARLLQGVELDRGCLEEAAREAASALLVVAELAADRLDGAEKDAIGVVRHLCHEIEDGRR